MNHNQPTTHLSTPTDGNDSDTGSKACERVYQSGCEIDFGSASSPDEGIQKQGETAMDTGLKRSQNSPPKINALPPKLLGKIFHWNIMPGGNSGGPKKGSYNFLLVCHHWFEVAKDTPEVWSFCGNTLKDWEQLHTYYNPATVVDIVLCDSVGGGGHLSNSLESVLQGHANQDTIRRVHLRSDCTLLLQSIIHSLTHKGGEVRSGRVESFILNNLKRGSAVDVSGFFTQNHFKKLQRLSLYPGYRISSWDSLAKATGGLTHLYLGPPVELSKPGILELFSILKSNPKSSQLLSILASNPLLQEVSFILFPFDNDNDDDDDESPRVELHHLQHLELKGHWRPIFRILKGLHYPVIPDKVLVSLSGCTATEISQIVEPYFWNHFQPGTFQSGLALQPRSTNLCVGSVTGIDPEVMNMGDGVVPKANPGQAFPGDAQVQAVLDLLPQPLSTKIRYLRALDKAATPGGMFDWFPDELETLHLARMPLTLISPEHNPDWKKDAFPGLKNLVLERIDSNKCGWDPLTNFLADRASSGKGLETLKISNSSHMCPEVAERVRELVLEFDPARDLTGTVSPESF